MTKIIIPLMDTLVLQQELQSLLTEDSISFSVKFDVTTILEKVTKVTKRFSESRLEIIKKYGNPVEGAMDTFSLEKSGAEDKEKGLKELEELADKPETFQVTPLKMADFKDMKSKFPYRILYKFLVK